MQVGSLIDAILSVFN